MGAQEHIKVVQSMYEAFARQDMDTVMNVMTDDVVWENYEGNPFRGTHRGHDGVMELMGVIDQVELDRFDIDRILADDEKAVAILTIGYTVKATGKRTEGLTVHIYEFEGDKISRAQEVAAHDEGVWAA